MNPKLYIFAIGGTGARVVKALTLLLASGAKLPNISTVVPIIVDPHRGNKDLQRTEDLLRAYQNIRSKLHQEPSDGDFFATDVKTLKNIASDSSALPDTYVFELQGVSDEKFEDYIDLGGLDSTNKLFAKLLFSEDNLKTKMDIGFVGNPNIGSVVLNQFKESPEFEYFAASFNDNDRIFIISSIFGGTGAAGFPIILKNIRGADEKVKNHKRLQNATIGAITVLPYFGIEPNKENLIDQATFISKTKAALSYYTRGVNPDVNKLYYIGDSISKNYPYDPGADGQKNKAHVIEMIAALSIIDFASDEDLKTENGRPITPTYHEFGLEDNAKSPLSLKDFNAQYSHPVFAKPLTKMAFFMSYMKNHIREAQGEATWTKTKPIIDKSFLSGNFVKHLQEMHDFFGDWLTEMAENERTFKPFNLTAPLAVLIEQYPPTKKGIMGFMQEKLDYPKYDDYLTRVEDDRKEDFPSVEDKLMWVLSKGTDKLLLNEYPNLFA